ncbi:hypothetical protein AB9F26_07610 [Falsihalocynthiibacter sp. BN13B15]|uniref:hypothetical protein n=1 Tax=Falsihalocynthiibacter sp. BN13B15 TaxID=3240871 RepID=UPI003510264C
MKKTMGRAIKFREQVLKDLRNPLNLLIWNRDDTYARDVEKRIKDAFAFYVDPDGVDFLQEGVQKLGEEDFFQAISNMELPFGSIWLEFDAKTEDGMNEGRIGVVADFIPDGLRVFSAQLFKLPEDKGLVILYSGSEVLFKRDGQVEILDNPAAFHQDLLSEREKGRLQRGVPPRDQIGEDTIRQRESDALRYAVRCVALLLAISGLHRRPEILDVEKSQEPSKRIVKQFERRGEAAPAYGLSVIRLGKEGRAAASIQHEEAKADGRLKRSAHWVRGHLFLARNGKLTWRKPHVRGEGVAIAKPRHFTS